jgi:TRAP-type C4-dicarboxylate transport system permease large subunit
MPRRGATRPIRRSSWREFFCASWIAIPALMTPGIIVGGKIFGWFTATEAACIAVLYGAVLSLLVYRDMDLAATGVFIAGVFLVVGCFLDAIPAIIICAPILEPLAKAVAMDRVHFAMIGIVSLAFGLVTPPYGLCLMIACSVAGIRIRDAIKDTGIMLVAMLLVLAIVVVWPKLSLWLPGLISPEFLR